MPRAQHQSVESGEVGPNGFDRGAGLGDRAQIGPYEVRAQ